MKFIPLFILFGLSMCVHLVAQTLPFSCGQKEYTERSFRKDPTLRTRQESLEHILLTRKAGREIAARREVAAAPHLLTAIPILLPVVVHIIHNNGPENISDLQVMTAIQHLNEAYANTGYYDPGDGVNTNIQFCLAERDPDNKSTNGITRDVSPYTLMNSTDPLDPFIDDQPVKNIRRWNPLCYINIWIVREISPVIEGYSSMPGAHGSLTDGLVIRAAAFGTSYGNDAVVTHEMGHYLGLYHTFEGGCTNTNCSVDGDRVCDTPPDQSTASIACGQSMNSCSTDALSGFTSDQNDLVKDYMDYGTLDCMTIFTQGQSDRMNGFIQAARASLLSCKSCMMPCPAPVKVNFNLPVILPDAGSVCTFVNTSSGAVSYEWYVNGVLVSSSHDLDYTFPAIGSYAIRLVGRSGNTALCADAEKTAYVMISCPPGGCGSLPPPVLDTCAIHTFQKDIHGTKHEFGESILVDAAGNYLITGETFSFGAGQADAAILKFDPAGHPLWMKALGDASVNIGYDAVMTKDGGSLHVSISRPVAAAYFTTIYKMDNAGNLLWSRDYKNAGSQLLALNIIGTSDGGALVAALLNGAVNIPYALLKLDVSGNVVWSKQYYSGVRIYPRRLLEEGDQYVVTGDVLNGPGAGALIFTVDKATGNQNWGKLYTFPGAINVAFFNLLSSGNRWLLPFTYGRLETGGTTSMHEGFLYTDKQGAAQAVYSMDGLTGSINARTDATIMGDGTVCLSYGPLEAADPPDARLARVTPDGKLVSAKRYVTGNPQTIQTIRSTPDGGVIALGNTLAAGSAGSLYLLKTDRNLRLADPSHEAGGCTIVDEYPVISQTSVTVITKPSVGLDLPIVVSGNPTAIADMNPTITDYCSNAALCQTLKISGSDSVCVSPYDTLTFKNGKAADCALTVSWQADPSTVKILSTTDSTVRMVFLSAGATTIYATLPVNCRILRDSFIVNALRSPSGIDLGGDLALCKQSTVRLQAGGGFKSYLWQNGYVDSIFTAYLPGEYFVTAHDYCDHSYGDTITISQAPDVAFDLGPDTFVCRTDTMVLTAPDGFLDYSWAPSYNMDGGYARSVALFPDRDTMYTCTASKGRGCILTDSIHISVKELPKGFLSPDNAVCVGTRSIELRASGQWEAYRWFDGVTEPMTLTPSPGIYWLEVTDVNGCTGRDSIRIQPGVCHPGVYFPNAFTPGHAGSNAVFRAVASVALDRFYMAVYNRWGERVFETRDVNAGWNGEYKSKVIGPDTFVWYAAYHLQGSTEGDKVMKGTVMLIR